MAVALAQCPYCGCTDLVDSRVRGDTVCGNPACGMVVEEGNMVTDVSFVDTGSGIAAAGVQVSWSGQGNTAGGLQTNQALAVQRGVEKMSYVADRLQLSQEVQRAGKRMYDLAVSLNFNKGRPTLLVGCACLYMVCRQNKSPHLLIDFSDVVRKPVKILARVYVSLLRRFVGGDPKVSAAQVARIAPGFQDVPIVDPSLFIERFAMKLGENFYRAKRLVVQNTAIRLIQFMHRDWICVGRRPNGLVGAALLIAGFYHKVDCSAKDIADAVRISEGTLSVRLAEMQQTPLGSLNRAEFERVDPKVPLPLADTIGPPCYRRRLRKVREAIEDAPQEGAGKQVDQDVDATQKTTLTNDDGDDAPKRRKLSLPTRHDGKPEEERPVELSAQLVQGSAGKDMADLCKKREPKASELDGIAQAVDLLTKREPEAADIEAIARTISDQLCENVLGASSACTASPGAEAGTLLPASAVQRLDDLLGGATLPSEIPSGQESHTGTSAKGTDDGAICDGRGDGLSDVSDTEIEAMMLTEQESKDKSAMWHEVNKDYLREWYERDRDRAQMRKERAAAAAETKSNQSGSKHSKGKKVRSHSSASSPADAVAAAVAARSSLGGPARINLDALNELFAD